MCLMERKIIDPETLNYARANRKGLNLAEVLLWTELRGSQLGPRFRRQVPMGPFVADFVCKSHKLIVELDGESHAWRDLQDGRRTDFLRGRGFKVIRFANWHVYDAMAWVLNEIAAELGGVPERSEEEGG